MDVKFSSEKPPVWGELVKAFNPDWDYVLVTYGNTIHFNMSKYDMMPQDLLVHELVHVRQQSEYHYAGILAKLRGMEGAKGWWKQYLEDPAFRLEQEIEAYRAQYVYIKKVEKDRNAANKHLVRLASDLSGTNYGKIITYQQAMIAIAK